MSIKGKVFQLGGLRDRRLGVILTILQLYLPVPTFMTNAAVVSSSGVQSINFLSPAWTNGAGYGGASVVSTTTPPPKPIISKVNCSSFGDWDCHCPKDPITARYPDHTDKSCERYFLCHMGHGFRKRCDPKDAFDPAKAECRPREQLPPGRCPPAIKCNRNGYREDASDCTRYYLCFYKQAYHYGCKSKYVFDKKKEKCVLNKAKAMSCLARRISLEKKAAAAAVKVIMKTTTPTTTTIDPLILLVLADLI